MAKKRWSQRVTKTSNALDLDAKVFTRSDPRSIARSGVRRSGAGAASPPPTGQGKTVIETVTPARDPDGRWRVAGYYIRPE
jgi:uncharacterized protein DUF3175